MSVRPAAVAGTFYSDEPTALRASIRALLSQASIPPGIRGDPKALILPHAGHLYSGPIAATGWKRLETRRGRLRRVVILGPAHYVPVRGIAASGARAFSTPLGDVSVDREGVAAALACDGVTVSDDAHAPEHAIEVHLPFLHVTLGEVPIVPLLVGSAPDALVARVLDVLWGGDETAIVTSSDLSHYEDAESAAAHDRRTASAIERLAPGDVRSGDACGAAAIRGLLLVARRRGLRASILDLRHSGDTAGSPDSVVGYGAFAFISGPP